MKQITFLLHFAQSKELMDCIIREASELLNPRVSKTKNSNNCPHSYFIP